MFYPFPENNNPLRVIEFPTILLARATKIKGGEGGGETWLFSDDLFLLHMIYVFSRFLREREKEGGGVVGVFDFFFK